MDEMFPVLAGVALGLVTAAIASARLRLVVQSIASLPLGFCASWVSGELDASAWYVLVDWAQVFAAAVMMAVLVKLWSARMNRPT